MKKYENIGIYNNIDRVDVLDDGSMNVMLKNGKEAIIEISKFNDRFIGAIYRWFGPDFRDKDEKKSIFTTLEKHAGYQECAKEALGWIDENPVEFTKIEEKEL